MLSGGDEQWAYRKCLTTSSCENSLKLQSLLYCVCHMLHYTYTVLIHIYDAQSLALESLGIQCIVELGLNPGKSELIKALITVYTGRMVCCCISILCFDPHFTCLGIQCIAEGLTQQVQVSWSLDRSLDQSLVPLCDAVTVCRATLCLSLLVHIYVNIYVYIFVFVKLYMCTSVFNEHWSWTLSMAATHPEHLHSHLTERG